MQKKTIQVGTTLGPYSPGLEMQIGPIKMLLISGQIPLDSSTGNLVEGGFTAQAEQVFKNIEAILEKAGFSLRDIVKLTLYLTDLANFAIINEICKKYLSEPFPARATLQISALPKGALIEIEAMAIH